MRAIMPEAGGGREWPHRRRPHQNFSYTPGLARKLLSTNGRPRLFGLDT
jgi:hypothetical protein